MSTAQDMAVRREAMIDDLRRRGVLHSERVTAALRTAPWHLLAPEQAPEPAGGERPTARQDSEHDTGVGSASAPWVWTTMLEQARLLPGLRVLEIGAGGVTTVLLAEMVGASGAVTTVHPDGDLLDRMTRSLRAAGYPTVRAVSGCTELGASRYGPYDRIVAPAGTWDIPPAWIDQLVDGGLLVTPLWMRGLTRCVAFRRAGNRLVSQDQRLCEHIPTPGRDTLHGQLVPLRAGEVWLRPDTDPPGPAITTANLTEVAAGPTVRLWSGIEVDDTEPLQDLDLWVATNATGLAHLTATAAAIDQGLAPPSARRGTPTLTTDGTIAYRTERPGANDRTTELGVTAHGPDTDALAGRYLELIRTWDQDHRLGPGPCIEAWPKRTPTVALPLGSLIEKKHIRLLIRWPWTGLNRSSRNIRVGQLIDHHRTVPADEPDEDSAWSYVRSDQVGRLGDQVPQRSAAPRG